MFKEYLCSVATKKPEEINVYGSFDLSRDIVYQVIDLRRIIKMKFLENLSLLMFSFC